jgi:hypothetical protein
MKLVIETTEFAGAKMPNHSYMLNDTGIAIGMRKFSAGPVTRFRTPLRLDIRGRTFKLVDDLGSDADVSSRVVEVAGSGTNVYSVDLDRKQCSCTGFSFRGTCKHIAIAEAQSKT